MERDNKFHLEMFQYIDPLKDDDVLDDDDGEVPEDEPPGSEDPSIIDMKNDCPYYHPDGFDAMLEKLANSPVRLEGGEELKRIAREGTNEQEVSNYCEEEEDDDYIQNEY